MDKKKVDCPICTRSMIREESVFVNVGIHSGQSFGPVKRSQSFSETVRDECAKKFEELMGWISATASS